MNLHGTWYVLSHLKGILRFRVIWIVVHECLAMSVAHGGVQMIGGLIAGSHEEVYKRGSFVACSHKKVIH